MFASSKHAVRSGLGGSALGIFYQMSKMHEKSHLRDQTSKELIETVAVALNKPEDVIAVQALRKSLTKDVRARDCPILHMEDTV